MSRNECVKYLASVPRRGDYRGPLMRTKVTVDKYVADDGREFPYIQARIEQCGPNGHYTMTPKGLTFRADDFEELIDALIKGRDVMREILKKNTGNGR